MKLTIETGTIEVWVLIPNIAVLYHPDEKKFEIGVYFLNYFLTLNIKTK